MTLSAEHQADLHDLLSLLCDGRASDADIARLEQIVLASDEARTFYVQYIHLHAAIARYSGGEQSLPLDASNQDAELEALLRSETRLRDQFRRLASFGPRLADAAKLLWGEIPPTTADAEWFIQEVPLKDLPPAPLAPLEAPQPEAIDPVRGWMGLSAAQWGLAAALLCVLLSLAALVTRWPEEPAAARLVAVAQARWGAEQLNLGDRLLAGKIMRLEFGAVEFRFADSATVVIRGPAQFQVLARGRFELIRGDMTAHVPPRAAGFVVESGGMVVTDLGTEFSLSVGTQGEAQVTVLEGSVNLDSPAGPHGGPQHLALVAGDSVGRDAAGDRMVAVAAPALESLPREIAAVRVPLPLRGAGVGLPAGEPDPDWRVTAVPDDPEYVPTPAFVGADQTAPGVYTPNEPQRSQWLIRRPEWIEDGPGVFVFEYGFDIDGVDPSTVVIKARLWADDVVPGVRLNGADTGLKSPAHLDCLMNQHCDLVLDHGFVAGRNRLEFDVENRQRHLAMRVALEGSGQLISRRLED